MSLDWVEVLTTFSFHSAKRRKIDESADKGEHLPIINILQTHMRKKPRSKLICDELYGKRPKISLMSQNYCLVGREAY